MTTEAQTAILELLDYERRTIIYPGVTRFSDEGVVRDVSPLNKSCEIVYCSCSESDVDRIIRKQIEFARRTGCELEWKLYEHDHPRSLGSHLVAAGFEGGAKEAFMVFSAGDDSVKRFGECRSDIRRVTTKEELKDVQFISEEVYGRSFEKQINLWGFMLENHPDSMSIYVAYIDGEPAASGRIYFHSESKFAGIYGGQTRERFRQRGLFTDIVAIRNSRSAQSGCCKRMRGRFADF